MNNRQHPKARMETGTVCFFNTNREWGGGEKWHLNTALLLRGRGYRVLVGAHAHGRLFKKAEEAGLPAFGISISNPSFLNPFKIIKLAAVFKNRSVRTVFLNLPADVKAAGIAAKIAGMDNIIYRRGTALAVADSMLNRFLFNRVLTRIFTNSEEIRRKLFEKNPAIVPAQKVSVIHNCIDAAQDLPPRPESRTVVMGNAARMVHQKGQFCLIDTARQLKHAGVDFILKIAGTGPLEKHLIAMAQEKGVDDRVVFQGFVDNVPAFLQGIDIFLLPSIHEGTANALLEAMALGIPAVAFRVSSLPEIISHRYNGLLADFPDTADFADKTLSLIRDRKLRQELGENARMDVRERFAPDIFIKKIEALIHTT